MIQSPMPQAILRVPCPFWDGDGYVTLLDGETRPPTFGDKKVTLNHLVGEFSEISLIIMHCLGWCHIMTPCETPFAFEDEKASFTGGRCHSLLVSCGGSVVGRSQCDST